MHRQDFYAQSCLVQKGTTLVVEIFSAEFCILWEEIKKSEGLYAGVSDAIHLTPKCSLGTMSQKYLL